MQSFVNSKPSALSQPFLLCLGTYSVPKQFFLVVDSIVIDCGTTCENAFNVLFSSFFTFREKYAKVLSEFFYFFEYAVFELVPKCSSNVASFVMMLECIENS